MPLYEYECQSCGQVVEALVRSMDEQVDCEACGKPKMEKLVSVPSSPSVKSGSLPMASSDQSCGAPRCCGGGCQM